MTAEKLEATAAEAATVVNGRIDGGFGPDMAAAVAMNGLNDGARAVAVVAVGLLWAGTRGYLCCAPLLVIVFYKDFCL